MRGYAIATDIGRGENLYFVDAHPMLANQSGSALYPRGSRLCSLPFVAFGFQGEGQPSTMQQILKRFPSSGSAQLSNSQLPMVIRFEKSGDISSAEEIDPNKLAAIAGPDASIKTTLEIVKDAISPKPAIWPDWLSKATFENKELHGNLQWSVSISKYMFEGE